MVSDLNFLGKSELSMTVIQCTVELYLPVKDLAIAVSCVVLTSKVSAVLMA